MIEVDRELFYPSEYGSFSPHSQIVDITKYENLKLSKEVKEVLYRPPKVRNLYDKYWKLAKVCEGREKQENDEEILKGHRVRYPKKKAEEFEFID